VRIAFDAEKSTPGARPDADGFVTWSVTLPAGGQAERKLRYALEKTKEVVGL
jgi:hypothetical protein